MWRYCDGQACLSISGKERYDGSITFLPKVKLHLLYKGRIIHEMIGILDSGADITLIPINIARALQLPVLGKTTGRGAGGLQTCLKSKVDIVFVSDTGMEVLQKVPVNIGNWKEILLGRQVVFDAFRIIFTQAERLIEMERMKEGLAA